MNMLYNIFHWLLNVHKIVYVIIDLRGALNLYSQILTLSVGLEI